MSILFLLISAAYYEFIPINHKFDAKLYFAINLDLEDYEKTKIFAILDSLKYSPITDSELVFLRSWLNIYFNKNHAELVDTLDNLSHKIESIPFEYSIFLLANFYYDPCENSVEKNIEKANFYYNKLENSNDPVILFNLAKFFSNFNQFEKAINFMWKSLNTGFNAYNGFINIKLCSMGKILNEEYGTILKFFLKNLILGDCNVLADFIAFLKYIKLIRKQKEKILELEINLINNNSSESSNTNNYIIDNQIKNISSNENYSEPNEKQTILINEISCLKKLYKKYSYYFFSFIHHNEDFLKLNKFLTLNYLINIPYFLMNSYTKGSFNGVINWDIVNSIALNEELQSKLNDRHKNYLLMLAAKNTNRKKDIIKYFNKYKEYTKELYENNFLQCYTLFQFEFFLKNIKNACYYLNIINSKNSLNPELFYSNMETFYIQEKVKSLLENKMNEDYINNNYSFYVNKGENIKLNDESNNNNSKNICIICMDSPKIIIFVPCGHKCCCQKCADIIFSMKKLCPICMIKIEYKISKVFD